ncbi:MAG: polysaccharide biosynthesis tyrosine autokinase [Acidobacteriota bacterium]
MPEQDRFRSLPPPDRPNPNLPALPGAHNVPWYGPEYELQEAGTPLSHYLWILRHHRWKILAFVSTCVIATLIVSARLTPIYEATATIDIDRRMPTGILGQESLQSATNDADQFLATQVKLIQSDAVLRPVVQRFKLTDLEQGAAPTRVQSVDAEDAPVKLRNLKVTRPPNTYLLLIAYRSADARLAADVANATAHSYIEQTYDIRYRSTLGLSSFMERQLEELKAKVERSGAALTQFERELNVINPEEKTSILSARLLQLNTEYTNAQADRVRKEAAYNSVKSGGAEAAQVSSQGESMRKLIERLSEAEEKHAQVKTQFGANHPEHRKAATQVAQLQTQIDQNTKSILRRVEVEYQEAVNREAMLKKEVALTRAEFDRLNARSFEYQSLKREAEADKKLYEELVRKIREAGINAGFQNSAIRLADSARPARKPVFPNTTLNLVLAFLFSSVLAVGAAVLSDVLDNTVRDPEQASRLFNTEVVGSLPMVKPWRDKLPRALPAGDGESKALVPVAESAGRSLSGFEEAIRTLRNSILLGADDRQLRSIMVTSAGPREGKTTTAVHLAVAHAQQKQRTLLIDGDLRRPGVHRMLGISADPGLSHVLSNGLKWKESVVKLESLPELDILPAGHATRRGADLLGPGLPQILEEAGADYDLVIVDSPPVLGFPEPLQMAAAVDGVVLISVAGETNRKAVSAAMTTLQRVRAHVIGLVLNEVTSHMGDGYHYYGYYGKYSKYYKPDGEGSPS